MASNPQNVQIQAIYYEQTNQLSFNLNPPFTSDESVTQFVFTLASEAVPDGTVSWADPAVFFETPAPSPLWPVNVVGQVLTIEDDNWNTFSKTPLRFPFKFQVLYNDEPRLIDPTIMNAQIPPGGGDGIPRKTSTASNP